MALVSILGIAIIVLLPVYLILVRAVSRVWLKYAIVIMAGGALLAVPTMHTILAGISIICLGSLIVWLEARKAKELT